jgi:regulator of sigma E protease
MLTLGLFLLALSILIIVHELGHFLPAKLFGMRVEKFYLFFDWPAKLWSFRKGKTEYGIGILPLGGYVKIAGMVDESSIGKRQSPTPPQPDEFRAKPLPQRMLVIAGGPLANVLYSYVVFLLLLTLGGKEKIAYHAWPMGFEPVPFLGIEAGDRILAVNGEPAYHPNLLDIQKVAQGTYTLTILRGKDTIQLSLSRAQCDTLLRKLLRKEEVFVPRLPPVVLPMEGGPAYRAGIREGDTIISMEGEAVHSFQEMREKLRRLGKDSVYLLVGRSSGRFMVGVKLDSLGRLGVWPAVHLPVQREKYSFSQALLEAGAMVYQTAALQIEGFRLLLTGQVRPTESLAGPIGIAKITAKQYEEGGWLQLLSFSAVLSLILAIMNLLPIPLLDGGHLLFLGLEAVFRKEPSYKVREVAQYIGLAIILGIMILAFWSDFRRL